MRRLAPHLIHVTSLCRFDLMQRHILLFDIYVRDAHYTPEP